MFRDLAVFARNRSKLLAIALGGRRNYNLSKKLVSTNYYCILNNFTFVTGSVAGGAMPIYFNGVRTFQH